MPNHYHFLLRQNSDIPIYRIFNDSFTSYVLHYNSKYKRKGSLFQGPLQHIRVKKHEYFVCLCKYIHYNPKKANLVKDLSEWKYSNYLEWINASKGELFSEELRDIIASDYRNYSVTLLDYEEYINERDFQKLVLDL